MENKVIVDDVDVSECKHLYSDEMCDSEQTLSCKCGKNKGCEYKQLQRAKAEIEELKRGNCVNCDFQKQYFSETKKLLQENERLKHQYADVLKLAKENADSNEYCLQELEQENEWLKEESDKLKQALRDIRECATTEMVEIATRKDYNGFLALQGISAKINEVIGAEE